MTANALGVTLLDFQLPPFSRVSWVSDAARDVWEKRFEAIDRAWPIWDIRCVASGQRSISLTYPEAGRITALAPEVARFGLRTHVLGYDDMRNYGFRERELPAGGVITGPLVQGRLVCGAPDAVDAFLEASGADDGATIEALLGIPTCCAQAHREAWIQHGMNDPTWATARATSASTSNLIETRGHWTANVLLRSIGLRAVSHSPCRFDCDATHAIGLSIQQQARDNGEEQLADWLEEILSWPVEWSMLHGIAEIKSPVLKISTRTDATAHKHVVQLDGERFPEEGAQGLSFAYRDPGRLKVTESRSFHKGLAAPTGMAADAAAVGRPGGDQ